MTTQNTRTKIPNHFKIFGSAVIALSFSAASLNTQAAVSFNVLHDFAGPDGRYPTGQLAQGRDGWLYGTTYSGFGTTQTVDGVAFKIKPDGTSFTIIHKFLHYSNEGSWPLGGLSSGRDGNFYGVTQAYAKQPSGIRISGSAGAIYKMTPAGVVSTLYTFNDTPVTNLYDARWAPIQAPDGNLYGTTVRGGKNNKGVVYRLNPVTKALTVLHHFENNQIDGYTPQAPLLWAQDGNLYGTTNRGGNDSTFGSGTVYKINPNGTNYKVLYNFNLLNGIWPLGPIAQGNDGNFYGATERGGTNRGNSLSGTIYKLTPQGVHTTLRSLSGVGAAFALGSAPATGLVLGSDGSFYGTTYFGGLPPSSGCGVLFKTSPSGVYSALHPMSQRIDGCFNESFIAQSSLFLHTNGQLYGLATVGGASVAGQAVDAGTVFRLGNGLPAFIKPDTDAAKVGATVGLLGDFTGVTKVTFNGVNAGFTKASNTFITAQVPVGAKTGAIVVTKGTAQVKSLKPFVVLP